jgi:hypothetical protein
VIDDKERLSFLSNGRYFSIVGVHIIQKKESKQRTICSKGKKKGKESKKIPKKNNISKVGRGGSEV